METFLDLQTCCIKSSNLSTFKISVGFILLFVQLTQTEQAFAMGTCTPRNGNGDFTERCKFLNLIPDYHLTTIIMSSMCLRNYQTQFFSIACFRLNQSVVHFKCQYTTPHYPTKFSDLCSILMKRFRTCKFQPFMM